MPWLTWMRNRHTENSTEDDFYGKEEHDVASMMFNLHASKKTSDDTER
jgi:hypothetical protein